jgi:GDP/UDP-N,N'-diacetylbacillosamine 2-epimerase (hydrolysing)
MNKKRKILAITGARSDYDLMTPVYELLDKDASFEFSILVSGAHLSKKYGMTESYIKKDGFHIEDRVFNLQDSDKRIARAISLGNQIVGFAKVFECVKPHIILVAGDREEALSTTATAAYMSIPTAHFFGGDITQDGNVDNSIRYAASKLAHIHFPVMEAHKETLLKLGEDDWRIFVTGSPALDKFIQTPEIGLKELSKKINFNITDGKYLMLIQHPVISEVENQAAYIKKTLDAVVESGYKCLINYPNSDAGNFAIIKAYKEYSVKFPQLFLFTNLERNTYVNLMRHASCMLGNSSSGICEAPSLGLPVVNIGTRQRGRIHAENVIFTGYNKNEILKAIQKSITDKVYIAKVKKVKNPYGDGHSSEKIVRILKKIKLDHKLIYKNIAYK